MAELAEKVKCELCDVSHRTGRKFRVCIVEHEYEEWMKYVCDMPRCGIGTVESYKRFINHIFPSMWWGYVRSMIHYRDDNRCQRCGKKSYQTDTHHLRPKSYGGLDNPDNLITVCTDCHKKHTKQLNSKKEKGGEVLANPIVPLQQVL